MDRLYRLGQVHEVHVYRYYVQGTLEMNIHQIQRRKAELALYVPVDISMTKFCTEDSW